jgi:pteridine reductase
METLRNKTVLITGAAQRIGRAITFRLVDAGCCIIAHFHGSEQEAHELLQEALARGGQCWLVRADLEHSSDVEGLIERASTAAARPIDALINNAAIFPTDMLASLSRESLARCLAVNAWAPLVLCQAFAKQTSRGHVINLLDEKILGYRFSHVAYQASKHVLAMLTNMLALDLAPGVLVNAIAPGLILPPRGQDQSWLEHEALASVPLRRPGKPDDIADAAAFLLSSGYLTGQIIYVDGGRHLLEPADGPHSH